MSANNIQLRAQSCSSHYTRFHERKTIAGINVYDSKKLNELPDEENPLDPINEIHSLAKRFMRAHGGYNRENLQDWMNLIAFLLSAPRDRYEKIDLFINMALNSTRVVKYRDVMSKKSSK